MSSISALRILADELKAFFCETRSSEVVAHVPSKALVPEGLPVGASRLEVSASTVNNVPKGLPVGTSHVDKNVLDVLSARVFNKDCRVGSRWSASVYAGRSNSSQAGLSK